MPAREVIDRSQIPDDALGVCARLATKSHGAWIVGGCVRDHLLARPVSDWDICTTAQPQEVLKLFPRAIATGMAHGTITVVLNKAHYEVTTLRGETTYADGRRPDAVFFVTDLTQDLARRDFTVNAIAYDPVKDLLVDPYGGMADLDRRLLRAVGDPMQRFGEDGLRVLRAARFVATLEFALDPATFAAIGPNLPTFRKVSAERVRDEWLKTMKAARPSQAFEVMRESGIMGVVCPALLEGVGCAQEPWHAHDVWSYTMRALDSVPPGDAMLRIAALLHAVGKPRTRAVNAATGEVTFAEWERVGADLAEEFLRAYRFSNEERVRAMHLLRNQRIAYSPAWTDADVRRFVQRVGRAALADMFALGRAAALATGRTDSDDVGLLEDLRARVDGVLRSGAALTAKELAVNGNDLQTALGVPPSKRLGELLTLLLDRVLDDPARNTRDELLALARELQATPAAG